MAESTVALLAAGMLVAAFVYASVGHGGASAYLAAMALAGVAPPEMRPIALSLNIVVSAIAICLVATLYPSRQAGRLDPAEALRHQ